MTTIERGDRHNILGEHIGTFLISLKEIAPVTRTTETFIKALISLYLRVGGMGHLHHDSSSE